MRNFPMPPSSAIVYEASLPEEELAVARQFARREAVRAQAFERAYGIKYFPEDALTVTRDDLVTPDGPRLAGHKPLDVNLDLDATPEAFARARDNAFAGTESSLDALAEAQLRQSEHRLRPHTTKEADPTTSAAGAALRQRNPLV